MEVTRFTDETESGLLAPQAGEAADSEAAGAGDLAAAVAASAAVVRVRIGEPHLAAGEHIDSSQNLTVLTHPRI